LNLVSSFTELTLGVRVTASERISVGLWDGATIKQSDVVLTLQKLQMAKVSHLFFAA
jgi:hypothetical protein